MAFADPPFGKECKGEAVTESPNLGILYIIGYAKPRLPNIEFTYLEPFLSMEEHLARVREIQPDVYAISFTTPRRDLSFETIAKVKALGYPMLMVAGGAKFVKENAYDRKAAVSLTIAGIAGVFLAAYVVKSLPLYILKWVVCGVVLYTSVWMFISSRQKDPETSANA